MTMLFCPRCHLHVETTRNRYHTHRDGYGVWCVNSGKPVPKELRP